MTLITRKKAGATLAAAALVTGVALGTAAPANAADTASVDLADLSETQSASNDVSIIDALGREFSINVTTTWQRASETQATLGTIVVRPGSLPGGECLLLDVGSTSNIGFSEGPRTLCGDGYLTYSPNTTVNAYAGTTTLGQLTFRVPDPADPGGAGAKWMYIEYAS